MDLARETLPRIRSKSFLKSMAAWSSSWITVLISYGLRSPLTLFVPLSPNSTGINIVLVMNSHCAAWNRFAAWNRH